MQLTEKQEGDWKKILRAFLCLAAWFVAIFVMGFFAKELSAATFFG